MRIFPTPERTARAVAHRVSAIVRSQPRLVLGGAAGRTPIPVYDALVRDFQAGRVDFSRVTAFSLDEFLGLSRADPRSFHAFLAARFFSRINIRRSAIHTLNGATRNPEEECARYEKAIRRAGGLDLQLLGLGSNGHIGFNEPHDCLQVATHRVRLRAESRRANADLFSGRVEDVPQEALTMGLGTIMSARKILLVATGAAKATAAARMLSGCCTTAVPASLLQLHSDVEVFLDEKAAGKLSRL